MTQQCSELMRENICFYSLRKIKVPYSSCKRSESTFGLWPDLVAPVELRRTRGMKMEISKICLWIVIMEFWIIWHFIWGDFYPILVLLCFKKKSKSDHVTSLLANLLRGIIVQRIIPKLILIKSNRPLAFWPQPTLTRHT